MQILCATDFSKPAQAAVDVAARLAFRTSHPLRLLHCGQDLVVMGEFPIPEPDDREISAQLKREADRLRATGIEVVEEFRRGNAGYEIVKAASREPTWMIVLGTTGKGRAERWLIGSVAERVAERAPVPTLMVRQPANLMAWLDEGVELRMLCGIDFSGSSDAAVMASKALAALGGVRLEAAHVQTGEFQRPDGEQQTALQQDVWERLHELLGDVSANVHVCPSSDHPAIEFLNKGIELGAGLIVVGTHQRHGLGRLRGASFSRAVVGHASTNVLCVPEVSIEKAPSVPVIRRILVPTDFTPQCEEAVRYAKSLLEAGGTIHLLHVCFQPASGIDQVFATEVYIDHSLATARSKEKAEKRLEMIRADFGGEPGLSLTSEVCIHRHITSAICETAERVGADLVCMGTKGHSRAGAALLGSTVQAVLARSRKPVLVVKSPVR
ncbi:MAG: universal stress protein [Verrucomicrobiales bacterium]|nr:universal stress protein [Verrucomicrobiales bacterium]